MCNTEGKTGKSVISVSWKASGKWVMCVLTRQPNDHFSSYIPKLERKSRRLPLVNISHVSSSTYKLCHSKTGIRCHHRAPRDLKCWHLSIAVWGSSAQFNVQFSALCSPDHYQWHRAPAVRCRQVTRAALGRDLHSCRTLGGFPVWDRDSCLNCSKRGRLLLPGRYLQPKILHTRPLWGEWRSQSQVGCCF